MIKHFEHKDKQLIFMFEWGLNSLNNLVGIKLKLLIPFLFFQQLKKNNFNDLVGIKLK